MGMGFLVVGVDGTDPSRAALIRAVDLAERLGLQVRVVHTYVAESSEVVRPGALYGATLRTVDAPRVGDTDPVLLAQRQLERFVEDVLGGQVPDDLEILVVDEGRPGDVLREQSRSAEYVVVGTRGAGPLSTLVFGSTAQRLTQTSSCPVVVVRSATD
jgi:nucleotide-binding universal stress UspA family protein